MNEMAVRVAFANAVKQQRSRLGISQEQLAERAALHRTYISDVERATRNLSLNSITRLASALEISIPALFAATPSSNPPAHDHATETGSNLPVQVVLVEDDPADVLLTMRAFQKARFANEVHVFHDGQSALDQLLGDADANASAIAKPHVVLVDLGLPKIGGLEVLRRLKADKRTETIPVEILTGSHRHQDIADCQRLGATAYLVKPVDFRSLSEVTPELKLNWVLTKPITAACA